MSLHRPSLLSCIALSAIALASSAYGQTRVTQFTFENGVPTVTAAAYTPPLNAEFGIGTASGVHATSSFWNSNFGNFSPTSFRATNWVTGDYFQFTANTQTFSNIWVTFAITRSSVGPSLATFGYSTDGGSNFTTLSPFTVQLSTFSGPGNPFQAFDLSGVAAAANNPNVIFRITAATNAPQAAGTLYIDDFIVSSGGPLFGNIPEPSTWALLAGGGLAGLVAIRRSARRTGIRG